MNERSPVESEAEVIVAGLGMTGATLALALARAGLRVAAVDAEPLDARLAPEFDGRCSAIAPAAMRSWDALGIGEALREGAEPITSILVTDMSAPGAASRAPAPVFLRFDAEELSSRSSRATTSAVRLNGIAPPDLIGGWAPPPRDQPESLPRLDPPPDQVGGSEGLIGRLAFPPDQGKERSPLGWMVENRRIRAVLARALEDAGVQVIAPARVAGVQVDARRATVRLADGHAVAAPLVVGAEGRRSAVRDAVGIGVNGWSYPQSGLVATVQLSEPHEGVAHEIFLPGGPLAVLPLTEHRANLVWTERHERARALVEASPTAFEAHLARRFGELLGAPKLIGARHVHPLALQVAERMTAPRTALLGDAAHAIHPLAGQGLNLGLKDAASLAEVIVDARRLGEDFGSEVVLDRYARWRRFDAATLAMTTDLFTRLFSNDDPLARLVRGAGLAVVNRLAPAKRLFVQEAAGTLGELPRLLRGEAL